MPSHITILYVVCGLLVASIGTLALRKKYRSSAGIALALFTYAVCAWMISLYFGFFLAGSQPELSLLSIRLAHSFASLFFMLLTVFFYLFLGLHPCFSKLVRYIYVGLAFLIALVAMTTPHVYEQVIMQDGWPVADIFGPLYLVFIAYILGSYVLIFWIAKLKFGVARGIDKIKLRIAVLGAGAFLLSLLIVNGILPLFDIYILQLESPAFSLLFIIPAFYSIIKYRFLDIKFIVTKVFKVALSLFISTIIAYLVMLTAQYLLVSWPPFLLISLDLGCGIIAFFFILKFLNSSTFHSIFGISDIEYFRQIITRLKNKDINYKTIELLNKSLRESFCRSLNISFARVVLIDYRNRKTYPNTIKHFESSNAILIKKELKLISGQDYSNLIPEVEKLGEVCLPLVNSSQKLIGILTLGKKKFDDPYFAEEIEAIKHLNPYLNLELTSILYKSELKKEVDRKTKNLKEMVQQQSDFITVSAHELRTPLNIALLQAEGLEGLLKKSKKEKSFGRMHSALKKLKSLTDQLFAVQRYDLKRANLDLKNVLITEFLSEIYDSFLPLMQSKSIRFHFKNQLSKDLKIKIDPEQMHQVFQNLLSNALKFTPKHGEVVLHAREATSDIRICVSNAGARIPDSMKKSVFEKFRSNHASKGKGIGLGLYLCKKIIQLHKGKIWIQDMPGGGANFCIRLNKEKKK